MFSLKSNHVKSYTDLNNNLYFWIPRVVFVHRFNCTGGPYHSRGLHPIKDPEISKLLITREHFFYIFMLLFVPKLKITEESTSNSKLWHLTVIRG